MDPTNRTRTVERGGPIGRSALRRSGTLLGSTAALLAACTDAPTAPPCTSVAVDTASVSGDTVTTVTGLRYIDGAPGGGGALGWCTAVAIVHYTGYLVDGTQFDSSRDIDRPLRFTPGVGSLIDGFEQGVIGMRAEGTRRLIIPPALGYGAEPVRDNTGTIIVPANSTLVFDVELLGIGT